MRWLLTIGFSCVALSAIWAQPQEPSLIDRLLRPNMELHNNAQGKQFVTRSAIIRNRASVGTFMLQPARLEKPFADTPALTATEFRSGPSTIARKNLSALDRSARVPGPVESPTIRDIQMVNPSENADQRRTFAHQHQFREQGKSQKSLDRKNPPMTIDQVRELLNKNK